MKFAYLSSALLAILAYGEAGFGFTGGSTGQVSTYVKWRAPVAVKRQISIGGDGSLILPGGLTLGGGGGGKNSTPPAAGGQGQPAQSTSLGDFIAAATGAARNQTGAAAGAAAGGKKGGQGQGAGQAPPGQPAAEGAGQKPGEANAAEPKAVAESGQFSENAGITIGADGTAQNLGGDLGITKGSDGSQSVGGESGINISPAAAAPAAAPAAPAAPAAK